MMRRRSEGGSRRSTNLKVISVDIGPRIGALHGHVRPESCGKKGESAESKNIDILRENIDTVSIFLPSLAFIPVLYCISMLIRRTSVHSSSLLYFDVQNRYYN